MRRRLTLITLAGMALAIGLATLAIAGRMPYVSSCLLSSSAEVSACPGRVIVDAEGTVVPKTLPKREFAPVALRLRGKVSTDNGTPPPALREATIDLDRNVRIHAQGLPVCGTSPSYAIRRPPGVPMCDEETRLGVGKAHIEIAFPEQTPILLASKLSLYNGGVKGGVTTLLAVAPITVPAPTDIVMMVEIHGIDKGRYGLQAVARIPVIAGGDGRLIDFKLEIERLSTTHMGKKESLLSARCPGNRLDTAISAVLENEAGTPGVPSTTVVKGTVPLPCTAQG